MNKMIYLDNAATTSVDPEVVQIMLPFMTEQYGNPSAVYRFADKTKRDVDRARRAVSELIHAKTDEIYFTSGGTEADNWALKAVAEAYADKGKHIITTAIEHHAILHTAEWLTKQGYEVTVLPVDEKGFVQLSELEKAIRNDTILISCMMANNEIGTIEPIAQISAIAKEHNILFHTDAVQALGKVPIDVEQLQIDLLSASAHKIHGPKGVGFLYIRNGLKLRSFMHGGAQERMRRAGTLNVPGIIGMGAACSMAMKTLETMDCSLRDHMIRRILTEIPDTSLNGDASNRLPNNINITFHGVNGDSLLIRLDQMGICASAGSACTSGSLDPSHVLLAIGLDSTAAKSALRFTTSKDTTKEEVDYVVNALKTCVTSLRNMKCRKS